MGIRPENNGSPSPAPKTPYQPRPGPPEALPSDILPDFAGLFRHVEQFVHKHLAVIDPAKDRQIPQFVKELLVNASSNEKINGHMSKWFPRACLIVKVIMMFLKDFVLQGVLYKGINPAAESYLAALKDGIFPDTSLRTKYESQRKISHEVTNIQQTPSFSTLLDPIVRVRSEALYNVIRHLMHGTTTNHMGDILPLMRHAFHVANHMARQMCDWRIDFVPENIVVRDYFVNRDPSCYKPLHRVIQDKMTVRLGFLPLVMRRDIIEVTGEVERRVFLPHVLLNL